MKQLYLLLIATVASVYGFSQKNWCGTIAAEQKLFEKHPEFIDVIQSKRLELEKFTQQKIASGASNRTSTNNYTIPVVFHIIHNGGAENISDQTIYDQIDRLNADYNGYADDSADVYPFFKPIVGNANIQFQLAQIDPDGNPTNGIMRYQQATPSGGFDDQDMGQGRQWPSDMYLNIYSVASLTNASAAAYTYRPGGAWYYDAIFSRYDYINGSSRTISHEVGHWFNLSHTWGDTNDPGIESNCNSDDHVDDTPNTIGQYGSCDKTEETCGSLDNVQNIMNYSSCNKGEMFTQGQIERMRTALESTIADRNNLWTASNLDLTGVSIAYGADFINPRIVCTSEKANFHDKTLLQGKNSWSWTFENGYPSSANDKETSTRYAESGLFEVLLDVSNGTSNLSKNKTEAIFVIDATGSPMPYNEDFENVAQIPNDNWLALNYEGDSKKWQTTTEAAYSGSTSIKLDNFGNTKKYTDVIYSNSIDLSVLSSASINMKIAYAQVGTSKDKLEVWSYKNCGKDSLPMGGFLTGSTIAGTNPAQADEFIPTSLSQWKSFSFPIINSTFLTENFIFKIKFVSDSGNNIFIDDINVTGVYKMYPILQYPENGQTAVPDNVLLDWKAVVGVDEYEYQLDTTDQFNSSLLVTGTKNYISQDPSSSDTEFETSGLIWGKTYYWRVRAITNGSPSTWSDTWNFKVSLNGVGIKEYQNLSDLKIVPNPVTDQAWLQINSTAYNVVSMSVFNVLGQKISTENNINLVPGLNTKLIDTEKLTKGIYFMEVTESGKSFVIKFIKE